MSSDEPAPDVLRTVQAGAKVIRGGTLRAAGYALGVLLAAATSVFLLRALGVEDFGRFATVAALLGIVSTFSDAGLTAVGARELAVLQPGPERAALLRVLIGLRIALTAAAVLAALAFAAVAGYDRTMLWGTALGGLGVLLVNTQATAMTVLSVELRFGAITAFEVLKQAATLAAVAALALAGAALLPFFAVQVLVGALALAVTPAALGHARALLPAWRHAHTRRLVREALPLALALAMNVLYLRLLVVLVFLLTDTVETGLFGTSFRVFELLVGLPTLVLSVALPLLAVAGADDRERLRYGLQALTDVALVASFGLALATFAVAEPAIRLLFGAEYEGAAPLLRIQAWALAPLFVGQVASLALVALRRQREVAVANAVAVTIALAAGIALVAGWGAEGAAAAAVLAEVVLAAALLGLLARRAPDAVPRFGALPRPLAALGAGLATLLLPLPDWVDAAAALAAFGVVAVLLGAVPREIWVALARRAPGDGP